MKTNEQPASGTTKRTPATPEARVLKAATALVNTKNALMINDYNYWIVSRRRFETLRRAVECLETKAATPGAEGEAE